MAFAPFERNRDEVIRAGGIRAAVTAGRFDLRGAALNSYLTSDRGNVRQALEALAEQGLAYAKQHCPKESEESAAKHQRESQVVQGKPRVPGRLKDSLEIIHQGVSGEDRHAFTNRGESLFGGVVLLVGSRMDYARRIEYSKEGGFLRGALALMAGGAHRINFGVAARLRNPGA